MNEVSAVTKNKACGGGGGQGPSATWGQSKKWMVCHCRGLSPELSRAGTDVQPSSV